MKNNYLPSEATFFTETSEETVVLDAKRNIFFSLEGTGRELWALVQLGSDYEALVNHLVESYDLPVEQAKEDVREFVEQLQTQGLIRVEK